MVDIEEIKASKHVWDAWLAVVAAIDDIDRIARRNPRSWKGFIMDDSDRFIEMLGDLSDKVDMVATQISAYQQFQDTASTWEEHGGHPSIDPEWVQGD